MLFSDEESFGKKATDSENEVTNEIPILQNKNTGVVLEFSAELSSKLAKKGTSDKKQNSPLKVISDDLSFDNKNVNKPIVSNLFDESSEEESSIFSKKYDIKVSTKRKNINLFEESDSDKEKTDILDRKLPNKEKPIAAKSSQITIEKNTKQRNSDSSDENDFLQQKIQPEQKSTFIQKE